MAITVDKTRSPIKITGTSVASTEVITGIIYIKHIYWYVPTTVGHICSLKDRSGGDIAVLACEVVNESQLFPVFTTFDGIFCDDLDSGTVYIYH